jgi:tripartite-type tricarboxylate transporter receptor subunit TctC
MNTEFVKTISESKFQEFLEQQFVVPAPTSPTEFAAFLKEDRKAAENLVKLAKTPRTQYSPETK